MRQIDDEVALANLSRGLYLDVHVKSPFYMNLGIGGLRNCGLFKDVTIKLILKNGHFVTFYETVTVNRAAGAGLGHFFVDIL